MQLVVEAGAKRILIPVRTNAILPTSLMPY
jgi:hypothetical protein